LLEEVGVVELEIAREEVVEQVDINILLLKV
jgi:hypothetical protein